MDSKTLDITVTFPAMLKGYRKFRNRSQLDLSLDAGVSQRHLSFLESGRSNPSREMILNLSLVLDLPLRDRNLLLISAGFTPFFKESPLNSDEMNAVYNTLKTSITHHEPYPVIVVDKDWNLLMNNAATDRFIALLGDTEETWKKVDPRGKKNIYRLTFHPDGLKPLIANWPELATILLLRLQREVNANPDNNELRVLLNDMVILSGIDLSNNISDNLYSLAPIIPMTLNLNGMALNMTSMISSFGTALDITAEELKVETFYPVDEITTEFFKKLAKL
jgi:transcriptional regulator with XRE-family HTH domain